MRFLEFGDSSLNFELAVWTIDMARSPTRFRSDLYFAIERKLRENDIEVPFPAARPAFAFGKFRAGGASRRTAGRQPARREK